MLGRVKVRIFGYHSADTSDISTDQLMYAVLSNAVTSASISGKGRSPTGLLEGSHVFGFFADGEDAQVPVIMGSYGGKPKEAGAVQDGDGFKDPNDKYPSYPPGEADTNRLTRAEKLDETIVQKKKDDKDTGVEIAYGGSWDQPETPYAAKYPYNHVYESEQGHITEMDDTEGAERLAQWHKAETWWEIGPDGTQVEVFQKDKYKIIVGDEFVHVKGNVDVTVEGVQKVLVVGNAYLEIKGNKFEHVHGNSTLQIDGNYTVTVNGTMKICHWFTVELSLHVSISIDLHK
jgi:hypothetical protein